MLLPLYAYFPNSTPVATDMLVIILRPMFRLQPGMCALHPRCHVCHIYCSSQMCMHVHSLSKATCMPCFTDTLGSAISESIQTCHCMHSMQKVHTVGPCLQ